MEAEQKAHPTATVECWAEDEGRLGLFPILCRVWAPRGQRPTASSQRRYQWVYLYAFVRPATGQTCWLILPTVNVEWMCKALEVFAQEVGAGEQRRILLVVDRAGFHTIPPERLPVGVQLVKLPPYSPELQPVECLWHWVKEAVANQHWPSLEALVAALSERCRGLILQPAAIQSQTLFPWWPERPNGDESK